jgi:RND family efflux transporter MFP subunit
MRRYRIIYLLIILSIALATLSACKKGKAAADNKPNGDDKQTVMVEALQPRSLSEYITVSGKLEGSTDVTMVSETGGRLINLYKKLGDRIAKGEKIGMVDNEVYRIRLEQAEAAELAAQSGFDTARLNLTTSENLFKNRSISQVEYNSALSAFKGAKAGLDGAKAGVESARNAYNNSFLIAPEAGVISNLMVSAGQYLNPGTPVAYITDNKALVIKTGVGESQIGKIRQGQSVDVFAPGKTAPVKATIKGFGIRPLPTSANYPVEIQLSGNNGLMPGMVVSAKILSGTYQNQIYTSINNIVKEFDRSYVFVIDKENKAIRKEIQTGRIIGENVLIISGVSVGEQIVTSGMENLEDGTAVTIRS